MCVRGCIPMQESKTLRVWPQQGSEIKCNMFRISCMRSWTNEGAYALLWEHVICHKLQCTREYQPFEIILPCTLQNKISPSLEHDICRISAEQTSTFRMNKLWMWFISVVAHQDNSKVVRAFFLQVSVNYNTKFWKYMMITTKNGCP
jgi:hypothetical protein